MLLTVKVIHLLGIILWMGGLMNLTRMISFHVQEESEVQKRLHYIENRIYKFVTLPGMIITLLAGIYMISTNTDYYMSQPWMHIKLLCVGILLAVTAVLHGKLDELANIHDKQSPNSFKIAHGVTGLLLIVILIMIYLRPFARIIAQ